MKNYVSILLVFLLPYSISCREVTSEDQLICQKIMDKLLESYWHTIPDTTGIEGPSIQIPTSYEKRSIAGYYTANNQIQIDPLVYRICQNMGKDKFEAALAYIIGHELYHWYECKVNRACGTTSFLYKENYAPPDSHEKKADIIGSIHAMMQGYNLETVIPDLIDRLYQEYNLKGQKSDSYFSYEKRKQVAAITVKTIKELKLVFQTANILTTIGEYKNAIELYEYFNEKYKSLEININIGVNYLLQGLNYSDYNEEQLIYPIELKSSTRLDKLPSESVSGKSVKGIREERERLYRKAQNKFCPIFSTCSTQAEVVIYLLNAALLLGNLNEVEEEYKNHIKNSNYFSVEQKQQAKLLCAMAMGKMDNGKKQEEGIKILKEMSKNKKFALRHIAQHNWEVLKGINKDRNVKSCAMPYSPKITLEKHVLREEIKIGNTLSLFHELDGSNVIQVSDSRRGKQLFLEIIPYKKTFSTSSCGTTFLTSNGELILLYEEEKTGFILDEFGESKQCFRYEYK